MSTKGKIGFAEMLLINIDIAGPASASTFQDAALLHTCTPPEIPQAQ